jgi:undecaprenyl-diphosphatase
LNRSSRLPAREWLRLLAFPLVLLPLGLLVLYGVADINFSPMFEWLQPFDSAVYKLIAETRSPAVTALSLALDFYGSFKGELLVLLALAPVIWLRFQSRLDLLFWVASYAGAWWANRVLKELFHRPRPTVEHLIQVAGYSFPSAHAMVSMAFYGALALILFRHWRGRKPVRAYFAALFLAGFVSMIGVSRIYLGVHFASDVAAGFAAGALCLWLSFIPYRRLAAGSRSSISLSA